MKLSEIRKWFDRKNFENLDIAGITRFEAVKGAMLTAKIAEYEKISLCEDSVRVGQSLAWYLGEIGRRIMEQDGRLISYEYGSVIAVWLSGRDNLDGVVKACRSVMDLTPPSDILSLKVSLGIAYGDAAMGNLGGEHYFQFSIVGPAVQLSRLAGQLHGILGATALSETEIGDCNYVPIGFIRHRGIDKIYRSYLILKNKIDDRAKEEWERGIAAFQEKQWNLAIEKFRECSKLVPELNRAAQVLSNTATGFENEGVSPKWLGEIITIE